MTGPTIWCDLKFYELTKIMRQANVAFFNVLKKIRNVEKLNANELLLIESRFVSKEAAAINCPHGIQLFLSNAAVQAYTNSIVNIAENKVPSFAKDIYTGSEVCF